MLTGAHMVIFSSDVEADRAFFSEVLELPSVDGGGGFLIYAVPPAELAVHEAASGGRHEVYLMCADIRAFIERLKRPGVACTPVADEGWGLLTEVSLPGGGKLGVYEPRHARPRWK
jgi:catechol 2,3-dioxygenase-like lactoylglutathione lyase family enzyme